MQMEEGTEVAIAKKFANLGFQVHPEAIELLQGYKHAHNDFGIDDVVEQVAELLGEDAASVVVISKEHIKAFVKERGERGFHHQLQEQRLKPRLKPMIIKSFGEKLFKQTLGKTDDFLSLFIDRYEKIGQEMRKRTNAPQIRFLNSGKSGNAGEEISVIGMVSSINKTGKGNLVVQLEDPTGHLPLVIPQHQEIILDEIIGVSGYLTDKGYLIGSRVIHPDVPVPVPLLSPATLKEEEKEEAVYAVFISDMHVGSKTFLENAWSRFVHWLKKEKIKVNIAYLIVAGDVVDGIGVYPHQEKDLAITDVKQQYKMAAECISQVPSSIYVVISPGNHDAVRNAEPQPPLPADFSTFFPDNAVFVSNPSYINIAGRTILIYHGQSYDDFVNNVRRLSYAKPEEVIVEMLRRRHVAPIYGNNVPIAPLSYDYGVIEPVPDILQCGHVHTVGITKYRNVLAINSGTWQSQTSYQKKRNINPVPGCATLVNLSTMKATVMEFANSKG
jgi:DNA polymerase II small subunit